MNIKTITTDRCIRISNERAILEGELTLPYEVSDLSAVLSISGCAEILSAVTDTERAIVSGKARFTVLYLTKSGIADSFDSECGFEHVIMVQDAVQGMKICANAHVIGTSWRIREDKIELRGEIGVDAVLHIPQEFNVVQADAEEDLQCDSVQEDMITCSTKCIKAYANNDIRIPQNLPEAQKILMTEAHAQLKSIGREDGQIIAEGELHLCIVYESTDKNAPIRYLHETVPFGEILKEPACEKDSEVFAELSVERISAELTAPDNISVSGVIAVTALCVNRRPLEFIRDAYSLTKDAHPEYCEIAVSRPILLDCMKKTLRQEVQIPESAPAAARILYATSYPEVMGVINEEAGLNIDGILHITLVYTTVDSGIKSIHLREPFEIEAGRFENVSEVRAFSEYTSAQGSGRNVDIKTALQLCIIAEKNDSFSAVSAMTLEERGTEPLSGIMIYFADDGEKIWDICKRCGVRADRAVPLDEPEPLRRGDRVMIMR